jgi:hypothetical protein
VFRRNHRATPFPDCRTGIKQCQQRSLRKPVEVEIRVGASLHVSTDTRDGAASTPSDFWLRDADSYHDRRRN